MRIGILSDTHDRVARTRIAVAMLQDEGAEALIHRGDLAHPPIVAACAVLPFWFVFGNHDADIVPLLRQAAGEFGVICLGWGDVIRLDGKRVGVAHGHMTTDVQRVLHSQPDVLLFGHSHLGSADGRQAEALLIALIGGFALAAWRPARLAAGLMPVAARAPVDSPVHAAHGA